MNDFNRSRPRWVVGNWKMNPSTTWDAQVLASGLSAELAPKSCAIGIAPTLTHLHHVKSTLEPINPSARLFAQDVSVHRGTGAFTGEISAELLANAGISMVLVGHSERRMHCADDETVISKKIAAALGAGLGVVLCVGENLTERDAGQAEQVVLAQLQAQLLQIDPVRWSSGVWIAYEPVWAIGTGRTASPADAQQMHAAIRAHLRAYDNRLENTLILYGGSVKPDNAASLAACPDIDGALVGGAALDAASFLAIAHAFSAG